ncbi:MAG: inositol monophosphatase [Deferribacteraceae bacterium]|jgi:myo-inositol-1(or 4)-monophosphatase|nr:inositol monophosphatase [Deferribacteraceae bacterium]
MIKRLLPIVESAGERFKEYYNSRDIEVTHKGEIDLVTQYDIAIEKLLTAELAKAFPDFTIIGEESSPKDTIILPGKVIYIDPIDGTTSFVHRFPFTAISVGVFVDEKPYCAVVCSPILGETYYAQRGEGAFMNGERIAVSKAERSVDALFATGFPYDREFRGEALKIFGRMLAISQGIRRTGSAAMDLCYVARGSFDMYYESQLRAWDMAAGILIVEEAGGKVSDIDGNSHDLSTRLLLATNGILHNEYLREIRSVNI